METVDIKTHPLTRPWLRELALFRKLDELQKLQHYHRRENAVDQLVAIVESMETFDGAVLPSWPGQIVIAPVPTDPGDWNVTFVDGSVEVSPAIAIRQSKAWKVTVVDVNAGHRENYFGVQSKAEALRDFFACVTPTVAGA